MAEPNITPAVAEDHHLYQRHGITALRRIHYATQFRQPPAVGINGKWVIDVARPTRTPLNETPRFNVMVFGRVGISCGCDFPVNFNRITINIEKRPAIALRSRRGLTENSSGQNHFRASENTQFPVYFDRRRFPKKQTPGEFRAECYDMLMISRPRFQFWRSGKFH